MAIRAAWWQSYKTPRADCVVCVNHWGDGLSYGGSTWRVVHVTTRTTAYIAFDRPLPEGDALVQLFQLLDARLDGSNSRG